jgi:acyl carrier protein
VNVDSIEQQIKAALYAVAPDLEGEPLAADTRYRDQFEFDSMDFLRFVMELHRRTGVEIPERDYPRLETLAAGVAYLREKARPAG